MSRNEPPDAEPTDRTERLPADAVADLLASDCRRRALSVLANAQEPIAVTDLARRVAALEGHTEPSDVADADSTDVDTGKRDRLRREIYQRHLPKLTATEVVTYDSLVETVELATDDDRLVDPDIDSSYDGDHPDTVEQK